MGNKDAMIATKMTVFCGFLDIRAEFAMIKLRHSNAAWRFHTGVINGNVSQSAGACRRAPSRGAR